MAGWVCVDSWTSFWTVGGDFCPGLRVVVVVVVVVVVTTVTTSPVSRSRISPVEGLTPRFLSRSMPPKSLFFSIGTICSADFSLLAYAESGGKVAGDSGDLSRLPSSRLRRLFFFCVSAVAMVGYTVIQYTGQKQNQDEWKGRNRRQWGGVSKVYPGMKTWQGMMSVDATDCDVFARAAIDVVLQIEAWPAPQEGEDQRVHRHLVAPPHQALASHAGRMSRPGMSSRDRSMLPEYHPNSTRVLRRERREHIMSHVHIPYCGLGQSHVIPQQQLRQCKIRRDVRKLHT